MSVHGRIPTLLHGPGCNLENGRGAPIVVHYWADLQSVHGFHCYDNICECEMSASVLADICTCSMPGCVCRRFFAEEIGLKGETAVMMFMLSSLH